MTGNMDIRVRSTKPSDGGLARAMADRLTVTLGAGRAPGLHGLVVMERGLVLLEHYGVGEDQKWGRSLGEITFGPETLHDIRSVTKSIVGLLYGIALADGRVPGPKEPLLRNFPEYSDLAADPRRRRLTIEHALTMTLGLEWNESVPYTSAANSEIAMELAADRHRFVLERPIVEEPGGRWLYSGGASAIIGQLISRGVGRPFQEFAREVLFKPLEITNFEWMAGRDGVASAASGLRLSPLDLARIGQTVLDRGRWRGQEVLPAAWLDEALRARVTIGDGRDYGYHWYLGTFPSHEGRSASSIRWFGGAGNGGQVLFVLPDLQLVVAITAGSYNLPDRHVTPLVIMDEVILASVRR